jgi:hypothetical protein
VVWIGELYGLKRSAKKNTLDDDGRRQLRQERARPILNRIHAYLRDVIDRVSTHPMSRIDELTPRRWKELRHSRSTQAAGRVRIAMASAELIAQTDTPLVIKRFAGGSPRSLVEVTSQAQRAQ